MTRKRNANGLSAWKRRGKYEPRGFMPFQTKVWPTDLLSSSVLNRELTKIQGLTRTPNPLPSVIDIPALFEIVYTAKELPYDRPKTIATRTIRR